MRDQNVKDAKTKTDKIYQEIADETGIPYNKVALCIKEGLFKYIKDEVFPEFKVIQLRGFGTFYISKRKLAGIQGTKLGEKYNERRNNKTPEGE